MAVNEGKGRSSKGTKRQQKWRERLNISRWAIATPRITLGFWIAVMVAGIFAFSSLKYALFPDITFPVVVVHASAPLSTPLDIEAELTEPIETQLQDLPGLNHSRSLVYPGQTVVNGIFEVGVNLEAIAPQLETDLNQLSLPQDTKVEVIPLNLNESSVISYAILSQTLSLETLREVAVSSFVPELSAVEGVLRVDIWGDGLDRNRETLPNPQLEEVLATQHPPTLVRFNGENALALSVVKRRNANTLDVVNRIEDEVAQLQENHTDLQLVLADTDAEYIQEATQSTIDALFLAIALAVLVIFAFLWNIPATLIAALAIPISLLATFIVMAIYGFNLETITLLALALVIGIIVDDAIVEIENIARHVELGKSPLKAAIAATNEIGLTVAASTLTIVAVFLPVAFMGGTVGQFFKPFGLTISAATIASLFVARTLTPILAVDWLKREKTFQQKPVRRYGVSRAYGQLLGWCLHHRWIVVSIALFSFIAGIALIPFIPKGFIPQLDRGEFNIVYTSELPKFSAPPPTETSEDRGSFSWLASLVQSPEPILLRKSRNVAEELEEVVLSFPDVESVYTIMGLRGEANKGKMRVMLKGDRQLSTLEMQQHLREELPKIPRVTLSVEDIQFVDTVDQKPVQVMLAGEDLVELNQAAQRFQERLAQLAGLADLEVTETGVRQSGDIPERIDRYQGERVTIFSANLTDGAAIGNISDEIIEIADTILPENIRLIIGGEGASSSEVLGSFGTTLTFSILSMLLLLWLLFGRLEEPIVVGLCLPLSIVGAMLALLITQSDFGMISLLGLIFLLGLLDKNALLLMDYANQLRQKGIDRYTALLETGKVRLRPILMTTGSTLLGMLPIALGFGAGAELRQPMAVAIMGGLITSTLLSLIVVPVLYTLLEDAWKWMIQKLTLNT
ncbi:MAG: efflux RND transporter permease subunit [Roseofilum sp. SBFL]|uniref:efflux RND transporter permease subunit n=1 Tax=unclassified Roseofilum TaxID=2620099 RepID=UPI001B1D2EFB|nr:MULTISPECIES: efflux RND transporter permease subunit [unclassified Roseofilum]MBP0012129.1 efflux RND transporter permease subunit [Roseofilum sp. SID3]MBP0023933.1 efflux RND transporter permease subunit [Roseofilum sp. SID2]MBP0039555.1 efflux RND transporter permease subunit [Roseofilum sp. SID1]MBP0044463.1 efflux RND transporter permease subunit [Roseofilum sp. SBFL]